MVSTEPCCCLNCNLHIYSNKNYDISLTFCDDKTIRIIGKCGKCLSISCWIQEPVIEFSEYFKMKNQFILFEPKI